MECRQVSKQNKTTASAKHTHTHTHTRTYKHTYRRAHLRGKKAFAAWRPKLLIKVVEEGVTSLLLGLVDGDCRAHHFNHAAACGSHEDADGSDPQGHPLTLPHLRSATVAKHKHVQCARVCASECV